MKDFIVNLNHKINDFELKVFNRINFESIFKKIYPKKDFDNITHLIVKDFGIIEIQELPKKLKHLDCSNNEIEKIVSLPNTLETLICYRNKIKILPNLNNHLKILDCSHNLLDDIFEIPESLSDLNIRGNSIKLSDLNFKNVKILDISYNTILWKYNEFLIPDKIEQLEMNYVNKSDKVFPKIILHNMLKILKAEGNIIKDISPIRSILRNLNLNNNFIENIEVSKNQTCVIELKNNPIKDYVHQNPRLNIIFKDEY